MHIIMHDLYCPFCLELTGKKRALTSERQYKLKCPTCECVCYQLVPIGRAYACHMCYKLFDDSWIRIPYEDWEQLPDTQLCDDCEQKLIKHIEEKIRKQKG